MKKIIRNVLLVVTLVVMLGAMTSCLSFTKFYMEEGRRSIGPISLGVPYTATIDYFGYVKPGVEPDGVVDGKKFYYLYLWIDIVAPEIGVRMLSPVSSVNGLKPNDKRVEAGSTIIAPTYEEGQNDTESFFDTYITFERALEIVTPEQIGDYASATWITYERNDDSSEMPTNPAGSRYNSLLRYQAVSDPTKPLVRGLYRIGFTTFKRGEVQGTFYAEVGAPIEIPGTYISKTPEGILEMMEAAKAE